MSNQYLRFPEVRKLTALSRSTIFRLERDGLFPSRRKISPRSVGWLFDEVTDWINSRSKIEASLNIENKSITRL